MKIVPKYYSRDSLDQWYSAFFARVPPDVISHNFVPSELLVCNSSYTQSIKTNKLRGLSPRANYTDRATTACWRS
jgi:hypothetical protein